MKKWLVLLFFSCLVYAAGAYQLPGLESLLEAAEENNLDLKRQVRAVEQAGENLPDFWKFADTRLNFGGTYNSNEEWGELSADAVGGSVSLSVPVIEQLELGASLNTRGDGNLSLAVKPFHFDTSRYMAEENYTRAVRAMEAGTADLQTLLEQAVLAWNGGQQNSRYLAAALKWNEANLAAVRKQLELDQATWDQLMTAEDNYFNARQRYYEGENTILKNRQNLSLLLGPGNEEMPVPVIDINILLEAVSKQAVEAEAVNSGEAGSVRLRNLELELDTLEKQLKATFPVQPSLSFSANLGLPEAGFGAQVSLSFSGSQLKFKEREELEQEISLKKADILTEKYRLAVETRRLWQSIRIADEVLRLSRNDAESMEVQLRELEFLAARGERTSLEVEQGWLNIQNASLRVYQGAVSLYSAQQEYLAMF